MSELHAYHTEHGDGSKLDGIVTWYDDYCFTCGKSVKRKGHYHSMHVLLSSLRHDGVFTREQLEAGLKAMRDERPK